MFLISCPLIIRILSDPQTISSLFYGVHSTLLDVDKRFDACLPIYIVTPFQTPLKIILAKLMVVFCLPVKDKYRLADVLLAVCQEVVSLFLWISAICIVVYSQKFFSTQNFITMRCKVSVLIVCSLGCLNDAKIVWHFSKVYSSITLPCADVNSVHFDRRLSLRSLMLICLLLY